MTEPSDAQIDIAARAIHSLSCLDEIHGERCTHYGHAGDAAHIEAHAALSATLPDRDTIFQAIYTSDRAGWLDPEDAEGIADDVLKTLRGEANDDA